MLGEGDKRFGFGLGRSAAAGDRDLVEVRLLTLAEATAVQRALAAAPWVSMGDRLQAELDWTDTGHVTVSLMPLLPEDPPDCEVDRSWP